MEKHCILGTKIERRRFLQLVSGGLAWCAAGPSRSFASPYRVGVSHRSDPYRATSEAVASSGEWPSGSLAGRTVVIKPNLITPDPADTGITTDPEVVRALVDLALQDGAEKFLIVEGSMGSAPFTECGYDFFSTYDPGGRVQLVDLNLQPEQLVKVPRGLAYGYLFMPECILGDDVFFISVGKMKTHFLTTATLSMKNLVGTTLMARYTDPEYYFWRDGLHGRGVDQSILDINLIRPIDFAVVDGIVAMEGHGPVEGDPVRMDLVIAGRNPVAVDRVCLGAMDIPQREAVVHLQYASQRALGPSTLSEISIQGDSITPYSFLLPNTPPMVKKPYVYPFFFSPGKKNSVNIIYSLSRPPCVVRMDIVRAYFYTIDLTHIRTIHDWTALDPGFKWATWDGRDDEGAIVTEPGLYAVRIMAKEAEEALFETCAFSWIYVVL